MNDPQSDSQAREAILQAITRLRARGCDITAYSVSSEAGIPRSAIITSAQFMQLVAQCRSLKNNKDSQESGKPPYLMDSEDAAQLESLTEMPERLHRELDQTQWENQVLRRYLKESQTENTKLSGELRREAENINQSVQLAWQHGYLAGQNAASGETQTPKSLVESLAEAAEAATAFGVQPTHPPTLPAAPLSVEPPPLPTRPAPEPAAGFSSEPLQQPTYLASDLIESHTPTEEMPAFVADVPLKIDNPDLLKDPFTAKLLSALQEEQAISHMELDSINPSYEDVTVSDMIIPHDQHLGASASHSSTFRTKADGPVDEHGQTSDDTADSQPDDLVDADLIQRSRVRHADPEISNNFTADELHSLFRNRYTRGEDVPEPVKAPESGQPAKKFVGTKHSVSQAEAMPNVPRVFPTDIRKACKLLGLNPEELSKVTVIESWKREIAKPGVHPDTGGDTEMAIYLNTAKDTLIHWVESQTPKLGKKFGQQAKTDNPKPQQRQE